MAEHNVPKSWCFTITNPKDSELDKIRNFAKNGENPDIVKMVAGLEGGGHNETHNVIPSGNSGYESSASEAAEEAAKDGVARTPHIQGAVTFKKAKRMKAVKELLGGRAHVEVMRDRERAFEYCKKEGNVIIDIGNPGPGQGHRSDLETAVECLIGEGIDMMINKHPVEYVKYTRGLTALANHHTKQRDTKPYVVWIYGATGVGKSRAVFELEGMDERKVWVSSDDLKWLDEYAGQEVAVIDDFRGDMCKFRWLLRLLDRYPVRAQIKGGFVKWRPRKIYITSAKSPRDAYTLEGEKLDQLERRIDKTIHAVDGELWKHRVALLDPGVGIEVVL